MTTSIRKRGGQNPSTLHGITCQNPRFLAARHPTQPTNFPPSSEFLLISKLNTQNSKPYQPRMKFLRPPSSGQRCDHSWAWRRNSYGDWGQVLRSDEGSKNRRGSNQVVIETTGFKISDLRAPVRSKDLLFRLLSFSIHLAARCGIHSDFAVQSSCTLGLTSGSTPGLKLRPCAAPHQIRWLLTRLTLGPPRSLAYFSSQQPLAQHQPVSQSTD